MTTLLSHFIGGTSRASTGAATLLDLNPSDARDWNPAPSAAGARRGQSDRFVLRFLKPAA